MASLLSSDRPYGRIVAIGGDDDIHRRLVDMGLVGAGYRVKAKRRGAMLVDYGDFSAVTRDAIAGLIEVSEGK